MLPPFGPSAWGFHLVSLLLHAAVVVVLFLFAEELLGDRVAASAAAALFALHPVHVEAVAWISAAADLELTLLYLLTFWCFLRLTHPAGGRRFGMQALMTASFALALLSKEQAITLPVLATIYEHFYRRDRERTRWFRKQVRYAPLWVVLLVYLALRTHVLGIVRARHAHAPAHCAAGDSVRPGLGGTIHRHTFPADSPVSLSRLLPQRQPAR